MTADWKDPAFARQWDAAHLAINPAREAHLAMLLEIAVRIPAGAILDLGCGSGLVAQMLLEHLPESSVIGIDSSRAMLDLARERLAAYSSRVLLAEADLTSLDRVVAPVDCSAAVAVQSLHHLDEPSYHKVIRWVHGHLRPDGWFYIIDRLGIPSADFYEAFVHARERHGLTDNPPDWPAYEAMLERNGDRPQSLQTILALLERSGFRAGVLDVRGDRGMIAALNRDG